MARRRVLQVNNCCRGPKFTEGPKLLEFKVVELSRWPSVDQTPNQTVQMYTIVTCIWKAHGGP